MCVYIYRERERYRDVEFLGRVGYPNVASAGRGKAQVMLNAHT